MDLTQVSDDEQSSAADLVEALPILPTQLQTQRTLAVPNVLPAVFYLFGI